MQRAPFIPAAAFIAAGLLCGQRLSGQPAKPLTPDRFAANVLQNRYPLSVQNGQFAGAGAGLLQSAIGQSRFVLVGETHGLVENPAFSAAVCNAAGPDRFHFMAIEEGPLVAAELERVAAERDGLAQLAAFEQQFPSSINMYHSREEFEMLQQCARASQSSPSSQGFHLFGLNQEGLGSAGLILTRILERPLAEASRQVMRQLLQKNDDAYRKAVQSGSIADLFMLSADDRELARGAETLQRVGNPEARALFASLVESHEINRLPPVEYDNARRRERLMKTHFADDYARAARSAAAPPRVLLKFGAYHIYRGLNPAKGSGIGNYVAELAEAQGVQSLHISLMPIKGRQPIFPRVGQPPQLATFTADSDPRSRYLQPILSNRLQSDWTLFDLRPLRHDFNALVGAANPDLAALVFGVDMLIVIPEGTPATEIR